MIQPPWFGGPQSLACECTTVCVWHCQQHLEQQCGCSSTAGPEAAHLRGPQRAVPARPRRGPARQPPRPSKLMQPSPPLFFSPFGAPDTRHWLRRATPGHCHPPCHASLHHNTEPPRPTPPVGGDTSRKRKGISLPLSALGHDRAQAAIESGDGETLIFQLDGGSFIPFAARSLFRRPRLMELIDVSTIDTNFKNLRLIQLQCNLNEN